jgi:uncharacterized OsmC-like protein
MTTAIWIILIVSIANLLIAVWNIAKTKKNSKINSKMCHIENSTKREKINDTSYIDKNPDLKTIDTKLPAGSIYTHMQVRDHKFRADETPEYGGKDQAPDPFDYIIAGMASCTAITIRQYAEKHDMPLEDVEISTQYRIAFPEDNPRPNNPAFRPNQMIKYIKLHGDLTPEQTEELLEISVSPAHKMIEDGAQIFTCKDN